MTEENARKIDDCTGEIQQIKSWINRNPLDSNIRYLTAYAVIKATGTIEIVMKDMIYEFLAESAKEEARTFLTKAIIDSSYNPSSGKIQGILEQFDNTRAEDFKNRINGTNEKVNLNALVHLRNDVAHGRTINVSIRTIESYYISAKTVIGFLDDVLT